MVERQAWLATLTALPLLACAGGPREDLACRPEPSAIIETAPGPEDFVAVPMGEGRWRLLVSTANRRLLAGAADGKIQSIDIGPEGTSAKAKDAWPPGGDPFRPVGLSYVPGDGQGDGVLYAIEAADLDRLMRLEIVGGTIEREIAPPIESPALTSPNDLVALPDGSLAVSNAPGALGMVGLDAGYQPLVVVRPDGTVRASDRHAEFGNGIAALDAGRLVLADYFGGRLIVYADNGDGLEPLCRVSVDGSPDNLSPGVGPTDGDVIYVAVQESWPKSILHLLTAGWVVSPSRVDALHVDRLVVPDKGGIDVPCGEDGTALEPIWADGGAHVGAGSTGLRLGDRLYVSQIVRPKIHVFACDQP